MKNLRLTNISIRNFKGLSAFDLPLNGTHAAIHGTNGTGKTTLFDAVSWLLFDKDSLNSAQFEIKPLSESGEPVHNLETEVEATFSDGTNETTLKKVYVEKWVKKRGSASKDFQGHTTNHFINGVPAKKKEYAQAVADICPDNLFLLLTNPRHFNSVMSWQDRRQTLLEICGDVTDEDVINSDPDLAPLTDVLGKHSIDDYRKIIKAKLPEINRQIDDIPVRISEVQRSMGEDLRSVKTVKSCIAVATGTRKDLVEKLSQIENGGEIAAARKELAEVEGKIIRVDNKLEKERQERRKAIDEERQALFNAVQEADAEMKSANSNHQDAILESNEIQVKIDSLSRAMDDLRNEWNRVNAEEFEFDQDTVCPTCGQAIPEEQLEKTRQIAREAFNDDKARKLKMINKQGLEHKAEVTALEVNLGDIEKNIADIEADIKKSESKLAQAKQKLDEFDHKSKSVNDSPDPGREKLTAEKQAIESKITALEAGAEGDAEKVRAEIATYDTQLEGLQAELAQIENQDKAEKRIKELAAEEKKLAGEYERLEGHLDLTDRFIKAKVGMLTDQINEKFSMVKWSLFADQINGGLREICIATVDGVPYDSLNNGARINAGLDVINVLSQHHGLSLPCFIDNAESVVDLMPTTAQQIRLVVSPDDKELRIEGGE